MMNRAYDSIAVSREHIIDRHFDLLEDGDLFSLGIAISNMDEPYDLDNAAKALVTHELERVVGPLEDEDDSDVFDDEDDEDSGRLHNEPLRPRIIWY